MSTKFQLLSSLPTVPSSTDLQTSNVLIIEWLCDGERRTGSELHEWMSKSRQGWSQLRKCGSKHDVLSAIAEATERARQLGYRPVVHIEAHGDLKGLEGPDGNGGTQRLAWDDLSGPLQELNVATTFNLAVFIAGCEGLAALQSLCVGQSLPAVMLAGPTTAILPGELLGLTKEFYRGWQKPGATATGIGESAARELYQSEFDWEPTVSLLYEGFIQALLLRGQKFRLTPHAPMLQAEWNQLVGVDRFPENSSRFGLDVSKACAAIDEFYAAGGNYVPDLFKD